MAAESTLLVVVALALIGAQGRVLVQRRPEGRTHGGLWEFPGGKVEPGEGASAAMVREIAEELGLVIDPADLEPVSFTESAPDPGARPLVLLLYACRRWQGAPVPEPDAALQWASFDALASLEMPPLDIPLAAALVAHLKNRS